MTSAAIEELLGMGDQRKGDRGEGSISEQSPRFGEVVKPPPEFEDKFLCW
jgi:hypothetical protein